MKNLCTVITASLAFSLLGSLPTLGSDNLSGKDLLAELRKGGHVVYIRHAATEKDYADQVSADPENCSTQRTLSEQGWDDAEFIGAAFKRLSIPVGALYSSQYCRAWQTARIAFGHPIKLADLNFEPAEEYTPEQVEAMRMRVEPLLATAPGMGTNTVIVGHDDPFEAVTGIYPEPQGVVYVVKPDGNGAFEVLGHVTPAGWNDLLGEAG